MDTNKTTKLQTTQISDTLSNLQTTNPILLDGQIAIARDSNNTYFTIGNGISNFNDLPLTLTGNYGSMIPDYSNIGLDNKISIGNKTGTVADSYGYYHLNSTTWTVDKVGFICYYITVDATHTSLVTWISCNVKINNITIDGNSIGYLSSGSSCIKFVGIQPINKGDTALFNIFCRGSNYTFASLNVFYYYIPPIFIADEQMIYSSLINRPDKWIVGTEYNFGDGLYGQRFTGSHSITTDGVGSEISTNVSNVIYINSYGGTSKTDLNINPVGTISYMSNINNHISVYPRIININSTNNLVIAINYSAIETVNYDLWVKYIK
jgi:hypothetical protein